MNDNLASPPALADVNALVQLADLLSDPKGAKKYLADLAATSAKIYDDLRATAQKADEISAKETALNDKEVTLGNREAAIVQREIALREQENALQDKLTALRAITG